ncbi:MAG: hypothetical protein JWO46_87 [Nocardioidaceae bacterium]|nr:hypothetical protein [Nocardioidaceae bacterium]
MDLSRYGREFYTVEIATDPQVTDWEASFDGGTTWADGEEVEAEENTWRWLVHGAAFVPAEGDVNESQLAAALVDVVRPHVRAVDNPEVVVRLSPTITIID